MDHKTFVTCKTLATELERVSTISSPTPLLVVLPLVYATLTKHALEQVWRVQQMLLPRAEQIVETHLVEAVIYKTRVMARALVSTGMEHLATMDTVAPQILAEQQHLTIVNMLHPTCRAQTHTFAHWTSALLATRLFASPMACHQHRVDACFTP